MIYIIYKKQKKEKVLKVEGNKRNKKYALVH